MLLAFIENLEGVVYPHWEKCQIRSKPLATQWLMDRIIGYWNLKHLIHVRKNVSDRCSDRKVALTNDARRASDLSAMTDRSAEPSEYSEENSEAWARCVDLPGLEDNVSPHNNIQNLVRVVIGEVCNNSVIKSKYFLSL